MKNKIPIVLLGGSINSAIGRAHVAALRMTGRFEIIAGYMSRDKDINMRSAQEYGLRLDATLGSLEQVIEFGLKHKATVLVLTPTNQHIEQVASLILAGLPVICEKALSSNFEGLKKVKKILENNSGFLAVIYNYTSYPAVRQIREYCASGEIGNAVSVNLQMPQESFSKKSLEGVPIQPQAWRLTDGEIPTISLDLGVHLHALASFVLGLKPIEVIGVESSSGNFPGLIDDVRAIVRYEKQLVASYWYSKIALGHRNGLSIQIFGTKGSLFWEQINPEYIKLSSDNGKVLLIDRGSPETLIMNSYAYTLFKPGHPAGFLEALSNYYFDISNALQNFFSGSQASNGYVLGIDEAIASFGFLKAIHESSKSGNWTTL